MLRKRIFFKPDYRPTQISLFLMSIMVTMIALAFVVINIGKTAKDKTYADNAADAGALAAASVMAYAFNYAAWANAGEEDKNFKDNWEDIEDVLKDHFDQAKNEIEPKYTNCSTEAKEETCTKCKSCDQIGIVATSYAKSASGNAEQYALQMDEIIKEGFVDASSDETQRGQELGVAPNGAHLQQALIEAVRERIHDDQDGANDLYQNALFAGYMYNFYNSGISHRLGRINAKRYSAFLQSITPQSISNCEEKTFSWMDGAFRYHTVTAIVCIDDARTYKMKISEDDQDTIEQNLKDARKAAANASQWAGNAAQESQQWATVATLSAETIYGGAKALYDCGGKILCLFCCETWWSPFGALPLCPGANFFGDTAMLGADAEMLEAVEKAKLAEDGLKNDKDKSFDNKEDSEDYVIQKIVDIDHNRKVTSYNFQFHMGGPIKGMRGDVDFPTFYPPVQSSATADFRGNGDIENGEAAFDARLTDF